ncbi:MAG: hypothetical protein AUJ86_01030 [Hydrogenophilaceae bacterium CG1_02_62_390]|nr:hypothetical protein [Betaproteobacteria bacterium]OIO79755.1 MAG: hypothetical protein AUJ86_01030 [Hydrogenophilaceae bacterium CG1_02_62_390]PIW38333.1 MAG: hypothetical protein COW23_07100 [Hydrogenophilales bacterium CG15_BIG_FIL_POST_REV_8_21_14_020_62_31]PIW72894.1 MAG: hypothetical protein COW07_00610 [Hydrogenophilales bacterium CG12_big_fil_rev_8_21_14_0_65_61_21]PIX02436.1 MAG: hypothetical protein COZ79_01725 [Hydrogenophilales bacterium CG_4_8_14_3_um_filter_62_83]PIY97463.1 MA
MLDLFPLPIFPEGALASSVVTTVWVGVFFVAYFNLRLGWVLSGLVVPGYLVPLLIVKPLSAVTVLGEGVLTYFLVWFYSEYLSRHGGWSNLFGRDRFFALVLVSVAVRIAMDGWLLPLLGSWLVARYQLVLDYGNSLHSFGLIIISLIANNFWKTGLRSGLMPMLTTIGLTYLVVRFGLMEFTNFNISNLGYMYEDMAASVLASPKAYIVLLTTAFIASRMNLLYGWDFAGILIPSLLALQWYEPWKIVASFAEAAIILMLAVLVLKTPLFQRTTVEGARKLLLFFNISFVYKFVLGYVLLWGWPEVKISDYYGFGYLLPTLIALKIHDKGIFARMSRAILQTSLVSVGLASVLGFSLTLLPSSLTLPTPAAESKALPPMAQRRESLLELLRQEKLALYRTRLDQTMARPLPKESAAFAEGSKHLLDYARRHDLPSLEEGRRWLNAANYQVERVEGHLLLLTEKMPRRNWGIYVIDTAATSELAVEVPAPLEEKGALEAAAWIFRLSAGRSLAIAGAARRANKDGSADVLLNPLTPYHGFHHASARANVLQVRAYTPESARLLGGTRQAGQMIDLAEPPTRLAVRHALPTGVRLDKIKEWMDTFELEWNDTPRANLQRETMQSGFAELLLNHQDIRKLLARSLLASQEVPVTEEERSIEGYLQDWLLAENKGRIAATGSNLYRPPRLEELLFFDDEVVTPLLRTAREHYRAQHWDSAGLESLKIIRAAAQAAGYELSRYHHLGTGTDYLILAEPDGAKRNYRGTYVFRLGPADTAIIQAPRPRHDVYSLEFAVALFEGLRARALLIGGAHPDANQDLSADILRMANKESLFSLVNQSLLRASQGQPAWAIQCRTMGSRADAPLPNTDILVALHNGLARRDSLDAPGRRLVTLLDRYELSWRFARGGAAEAGYDALGSPQSLAVNATLDKTFAVLWLAPGSRSGFRQQSEHTPQEMQFLALAIPNVEADLYRYLAQHPLMMPATTLPTELHTLLRPYFTSQDIVALVAARQRFPALRWQRLTDVNSRLGFLLLLDATGRHVLAVVNLSARQPDSYLAAASGTLSRATVERFVNSGAAWLEIRP